MRVDVFPPDKPRRPEDWLANDELMWRAASQGFIPIRSLPPSNTFIRAAHHNTRHLKPNEYRHIIERHDYYDLMSYVLQYDPGTVAAIRGIRFFHATTVVTGKTVVGAVDTRAGRWAVSSAGVKVLEDVNKILFELNMSVLRNLIFIWKQPRPPVTTKVLQEGNGAQVLSPFDFDIAMVHAEQFTVDRYMERAKPPRSVVDELSELLDPNLYTRLIAVLFNPIREQLLWAIDALRVEELSFDKTDHRIAIGVAAVHQFHRRNQDSYRRYMAQLNSRRYTPVRLSK